MDMDRRLRELRLICSLSRTELSEEERKDVVVVVDDPYSESVFHFFIDLGFAGIVFNQQPQHDTADRRIGWFDSSTLSYQLPQVEFSGVFVCSLITRLLGLRALKAIIERRVSTMYVVTENYWRLERASIWSLVARVVWRRVSLKGAVLLDNLQDAHPWMRVFAGFPRDLNFEGNVCHLGQEVEPACEQKVALVCGSLGAGGAERQVVNTALGLKRRGWNNIAVYAPYVHSFPKADFYLEQLEANQVDVFAPRFGGIGGIEEKDLPVVYDIWRSLSRYPDVSDLFLALVEAFTEDRPDIVHGWLDQTSIAAGFAALVVGVPKIFLGARSLTPRHFAFEQPYMRWSYRYLLAKDQVIMLNNSVAGAEDYAGWVGVDEEDIVVLRNGIDFSQLQRASDLATDDKRYNLAVPDGQKVVATLIRFTAEKRPMLWVKIAQKVLDKRPDVCFVMWGDGPLRGPTQKWIDENGLANNFRLPGHEKNVGLALSIVDCFLLTSSTEGLPNVLLEAQSLGVPVVTSNAGGAKEAVDLTAGSCVVEGDDPDAYAAKIVDLLGSDRSWDERFERGRDFVEKSFGLERMLNETIELYSQQVGQEGS